MYQASEEERLRARRYYNNVQSFLHDVNVPDEVDPDDYITGTQRIEFYGDRLKKEHFFTIHDTNLTGGASYEEAIMSRIVERKEFSCLILLGGLGAGKTTTVKWVLRELDKRKENFRITKCNHSCNICHRTPLMIDCNSLNRDEPQSDTILSLTQLLRTEIYDKVLREWFQKNNEDPRVLKDVYTSKLLRCLIIANDLPLWVQQNRLAISLDSLLPPEDLQNDAPILKLTPDSDTLRVLTHKFKGHLTKMDAFLTRVHHHQRDNIDFTTALLRFYLSLCPPNNPQNIMVIDNLDHLPTRHIEEIARVVYQISNQISYFQTLLPLRPSSVFPAGFIKSMEAWYHYGPDCFEMVLHRLERYILQRPRSELREETQGRDKYFPFSSRPSKEEVDFLLVASYLYASVLSMSSQERPTGVVNFDASHSALLSNITVSHRAGMEISRTMGALVGTCARYANEQIKRYLNNIYHFPDIVFAALRRSGSGASATTVSVPYKVIIDSIIFDSVGNALTERIVNVYLPTSRSANETMPSTCKIRVLQFLKHWKRVTVTEILRHLALYGVPSEIALASLNSLHKKERLLIWFSENHDLRSEELDGSQYVVISEHGLSYLEHVVGDFEYVWACSAQILDQDLRSSRFNVRLEAYVRLLKGFGEAEWKQIAFRRAFAGYSSEALYLPVDGALLTLSILYQSLARAVGSAQPVLLFGSKSNRPERVDVATELENLLEHVCSLILEWQGKYQLAYGGRGYLSRYSESIDRAREALTALLETCKLGSACRAGVDDVLESWRQEDEGGYVVRLTEAGALATDEDIITRLSKYLRAFLPFPKEWLEKADKNVAFDVHVKRFQQSEVWLGHVLEHRLPSYREVEDGLRQLGRNIVPLITLASEIGAATGTDFYERLLRERDWIEASIERLGQSELTDSHPCTSLEMSERKAKFNSIMNIFQDLASRYAVGSLAHLRVVWN